MNKELVIIIADRVVERLNHEGYVCFPENGYDQFEEDKSEEMKYLKNLVIEVIEAMTEGERSG